MFNHEGGHLMFRFPDWILATSYWIYWASEIICPFGYFMPAIIRVPCAATCIALMVGIQVTGNFGHFQFLTCSLCVPLLIDLSFDGAYGSYMPSCILCMHGILSLLPFAIANSWVCKSWFDWPAFRFIEFLRPLCSLYRVFTRWGIMFAYGVFPPGRQAIVRPVPIFQASNDNGKTWCEYKYRFNQSSNFLPLLTPRFDFWNFYLGLDGEMSPMLDSDPYNAYKFLTLESVQYAVLSRKSDALRLFANDPFKGQPPPSQARVILRSQVPNPRYPKEPGSNIYLSKDEVEMFPAVTLEELKEPVYSLTLSHIDSWSWRCQSGRLMQTFQNVDQLLGANHDLDKDFVLKCLDELFADKEAEFGELDGKAATCWFEEWLPACKLEKLAPMCDRSFAYALQSAQTTRKTFGEGKWQQFVHRGHYLTLYLLHRLEGYYFTNDLKKKPKVPSFYHLGLFCAATVLQGADAVRQVLQVSSSDHDTFACELGNWDWREGVAAMAFLHPRRFRQACIVARINQHYQRVSFTNVDQQMEEILPGFLQIFVKFLAREDVSSFITIDSWEVKAWNDLLWPLASLESEKSKCNQFLPTGLLQRGARGGTPGSREKKKSK